MSREFFENMDQYFKDGEAFQKTIIKNWLDKEKLDHSDLEILFTGITEQYVYKSFPNLSNIIKIWDNVKSQSFSNSNFTDDMFLEVQRWYSFDAETIIDVMEGIWRKKKKENLEPTEELFYCTFSSLFNEYWTMRDRGFMSDQLFKRLEEIKICLQDGKEFTSICYESVREQPISEIQNFSDAVCQENLLD